MHRRMKSTHTHSRPGASPGPSLQSTQPAISRRRSEHTRGTNLRSHLALNLSGQHSYPKHMLGWNAASALACISRYILQQRGSTPSYFNIWASLGKEIQMLHAYMADAWTRWPWKISSNPNHSMLQHQHFSKHLLLRTFRTFLFPKMKIYQKFFCLNRFILFTLLRG